MFGAAVLPISYVYFWICSDRFNSYRVRYSMSLDNIGIVPVLEAHFFTKTASNFVDRLRLIAADFMKRK